METQVNGTRVARTKSLKTEKWMQEFYGEDPKKAELAEKAIIAEGQRLMDAIKVKNLSAAELKGDKNFIAFQKLVNYCASEIAKNGITKTEESVLPAPIRLMNVLKQQATDTLGELSTGAQDIITTRNVVKESTRATEKQQKIMQRVKTEPADFIQEFVEALKRNNTLTQKQIELETAKLKKLQEFFPHTSSLATIKLDDKEQIVPQIEVVEEKDNELQCMRDIQESMKKLRSVEKAKKEFSKALKESEGEDKENYKKNIDSCKKSIENLKKKIDVSIMKLFDKDSQRKVKKLINSKKLYGAKIRKIAKYVKNAELERDAAYTYMAKTVLAAIDGNNVVADKAYPEDKILALRAKAMDLAPNYKGKKGKSKAKAKGKGKGVYFSKKVDKAKKGAPVADEDSKNISREELKNYVYHIQDLIKASKKKINELNDAIADREDFIAEMENNNKVVKNFEELANKKYSINDVRNWLDEKAENGEDLESVIRKNATKKVIESYKGNKGVFSRWMNGIKLFVKRLTRKGRAEFNTAVEIEAEGMASQAFAYEKSQELQNKVRSYNAANDYVSDKRSKFIDSIKNSDTTIQNYALKRAQGTKTEEAIAQKIVDVAVDSTMRGKSFDELLKVNLHYGKLKKDLANNPSKFYGKKLPRSKKENTTEPFLSF